MTARDVAKNRHERHFGEVVELDIDTCLNAHGVGACTAGRVHSGTAVGSMPTALTLAAGASADADAYNRHAVVLTGGMGAGQERLIVDYAVATNLLTYSEQFENAAWSRSGLLSISADAVVGPDGSTTADKIYENATTSGAHEQYRTYTGTSAKYVASVYVKAGERSRVRLWFITAAAALGVSAVFDLAAGSVVQLFNHGATTDGAATIQAAGGGWYRISVSCTGSAATWYHDVMLVNSGVAYVYAGTVNSGLYIWGAQLEQSASLGPYVATTSGSATGKVAITDRPWLINLAPNSEDFSSWSAVRVGVSTNVAVATNGEMSADKVVDTAVSGIHTVGKTINVNAAASCCFSIHIKAAGRAKFRLYIFDQAATSYIFGGFDLSTGTLLGVGGVGGSNAVQAIESAGDGFYRCSIAGIPGVGITAIAQIRLLSDGGVESYTGDGVSGLLAWGAQFEQAADPSPYIATTTTAVTLPDTTTTYTLINRPAACYNTFRTCQDSANFARGTRTLKFCSRGMAPPAGETIRPYITDVNVVPTEIVPGKGLSMRSTTSVAMVDETCPDHLDDPYAASRAAPAGGTWWGRFMARNNNAAGRLARVRRGYITAPFDWATFQDELYIITGLSGPDRGKIKLTLQDPTKLLDVAKLPAPTDGKLLAAVADIADTGVAVAGAATTITLRAGASAVDDAYNGMECYLVQNTGAGQRRVITDYVGATRVATVAAWSVNPDATTVYEVSALSLTLDSGKGAQYADPATSGKPEFVRVGSEVIRYTARSGDTLSWTDSSHRAQFGSTRADHKAGDQVQLCWAVIAQSPATVIERLLNDGGMDDGLIDLAGLAAEETQWLSTASDITACFASPETASVLLADLLIDLNACTWWDAVAQLARFKVNMPEIAAGTRLTDDAFIADSIRVEVADKERITEQALYYGLRDATADAKKTEVYQRAVLYIDTDAESANEYGDVRPAVRLSRWLTADNDAMAAAWCGRMVGRLRDAPKKIRFALDPRNEVAIGALVAINTREVVDAHGQPAEMIVRIVKVEDQGSQQEVAALATAFNLRYGFIAPNGLPDYPAASDAERLYAFIATTATGKMSNGDMGYVIS